MLYIPYTVVVSCLRTQVQLQSSDKGFRSPLLNNLCEIIEGTKKSHVKIDFCLFKFRREGFIVVTFIIVVLGIKPRVSYM